MKRLRGPGSNKEKEVGGSGKGTPASIRDQEQLSSLHGPYRIVQD